MTAASNVNTFDLMP